jgi:hypothetical protein
MPAEMRRGLTRRDLLSRGAAVGAIAVAGPGFVAAPDAAWALETQALTPQTMATLIQIARDTYPHDRIADRFYAVAVKGHDEKAAADPAHKALIEAGVAELDALAAAAHGVGYAAVGWEVDRVALLKQVASGPFFQTVRGGLVVSLYNQKEVWPIFGYEGESFSQGGYIARGFDDIDWL